jgi:hypothetical protein
MQESSIENARVIFFFFFFFFSFKVKYTCSRTKMICMHGWWVPFIDEAWTKVYRMDKAHIVLTSDPRNDCYKIDNRLMTSVVM